MTSRPANHSGFLIALVGTIATLLIAATPVVAQEPPHRAPTNTQPAEANIEAAEATTPKPEQQRPSVWGEPTEVRVGIYVIDVDGVNSANQNFSASVYYEARWNSPILRHKGPGPVGQNRVADEHVARIRWPEVVDIDGVD